MEAAVKLSHRYIADRFLPDKARAWGVGGAAARWLGLAPAVLAQWRAPRQPAVPPSPALS
jgi:hypothetical protein